MKLALPKHTMDTHTNCARSRHLPFQPALCSVAVVIALLVLLVGVRQSAAQTTGQSQSAPATRVATTERFEFHSDPWINLHHFLYHWAREEEGLGSGRRHVPVPERSSLEELPEQDQRAWMRAVVFYRDSVAARTHFDTPMLEQKRQLIALDDDPEATLPDAIPGIADALAAAMPIYRSQWWPIHDQANRAWIASIRPLLERHEARYVEMTNRIYGAEWPTVRVRVDVSAYANPRAGYTAQGHIVIYSTDPGNQDLYALETLLHEVQHTRAVGSAARKRLTRAFASAQTDRPRNLWHGVIFATAGAFVRSVAEQEGLPEHVPYWVREGFETFQGWSAVVAATQEHWTPVVRGETLAEDGVIALVERFSNH